MKNGELLYDAAMAQIEQMPEARKEPIKAAFTNCKDKGRRILHNKIVFFFQKIFVF